MSNVATVKFELSDEQMDVLLRDIGDLIGKVDALERRVKNLEANMFTHHAIAMNHSDSIEEMWRKLNHKGGSE